MQLTKTNLRGGLLLTSRKQLTQLIMRSSLKSCGIMESEESLMTDFNLRKRTQYVSIDGILPDLHKVNFRVLKV